MPKQLGGNFMQLDASNNLRIWEYFKNYAAENLRILSVFKNQRPILTIEFEVTIK